MVLHVIETGGPGGAERMLVHLASGLRNGYRAEAALIRDTSLGTTLRECGIPVTMLRHKVHGFSDTVWDLVRLIRRRSVAIIHGHEFFMNVVGLVASEITGVPLVATVHGKNYYADRVRRRLAYRAVGRWAARLVTVSENTKRFLAERVGISPARIHVIPNGVPIDPDDSLSRAPSPLRAALGLGEQRVVCTVGSLYAVKGHRYLLDAARDVLRRWPSTVFLIIGRGGLRAELEAQAERLGIERHVRFLGHRDDVRQLLAVCDVFVLPSLSEGMPLALLEAMAAGVPVVATRVGGVEEVIEHGTNGLLVPPGDSRVITECVVSLFDDPLTARGIGASASDTVRGRFSLTRMVDAYEQLYAAVTDRRA